MTELDHAIQIAYASHGHQDAVNKVHLKLLQTLLFIPIRKNNPTEEPFLPLYTQIENQYFMTVFDTQEKCEQWAGVFLAEMDITQLSGHDVILGINPDVFLSLNTGTDFYKEFSPDEINYLKKIAIKIE